MIAQFAKACRRRVKTLAGALAPAWVLAGCTPVVTPYVFLQYGKDLQSVDLAKVVEENPLGPTENIRFVNLGRGQGSSHHVVQIRERETPHLHKAHDATVTIVRGRGYLVMDTRRINLTAGDIVHIPRGAAHYYVNTDFQPTVVFVVYSPPFDGKDIVPAKLP